MTGHSAASSSMSRRGFLKAAGATSLAWAGVAQAAKRPSLAAGRAAVAADVRRLHDSLTPEQRSIVLLPFGHEARRRVASSWHVVDPARGAIGAVFSSEQQEIVRRILRSVTSDDGHARFERQMRDDAGGIENYTCALFGTPEEGRLQWLLTGRHLTIRAGGDGNSVLGGPLFYGHAVAFHEQPDHAGNVWWHQGGLANKVFAALDDEQRRRALLERAPADSAGSIELRGRRADFEGIPVADLSRDQKHLIDETLGGLTSMFSEPVAAEMMECLQKNGGADGLHLSFYRQGDLGGDGVWERWKLEGPAFVWYFRGSPHVHVWLNVAHRVRRELRSATF